MQDSMQPILPLFFWLKVRADVFQALYMSRQRGSFPGVCAGLFTTWPVSLFDTDTLLQGPETRLSLQDNEIERHLSGTHNVAYPLPIKTQWIKELASLVLQMLGLFSITCTLVVHFLNDAHSHKHMQAYHNLKDQNVPPLDLFLNIT